jgi:hypothetical protein
MPVRRPRAPLAGLLRRELVRREHAATAALIHDLAGVRARGCFTRGEFVRMCRWKSPRAQHLWRSNPAARVRAVSRATLATRSERRRMELLTSLRGVGIPIASAILTLVDPRRYGVLDIRAWQLLLAARSVTANRRGQGFTIAQWEEYLSALRHHARRLGVTARAVEYTLFEAHRRRQRGTLYAPPTPAPGRDDSRSGRVVQARRARRLPGGGRARGLPSDSARARRRPAVVRG